MKPLFMHGNYVIDEYEIEQQHNEMRMLHKNMFIQNKL